MTIEESVYSTGATMVSKWMPRGVVMSVGMRIKFTRPGQIDGEGRDEGAVPPNRKQSQRDEGKPITWLMRSAVCLECPGRITE